MDRFHPNPLAKVSRPSARTHLRQFDFTVVNFDGDVRLSFSAVPKILEALNKEKVSFVLNKVAFPDPIESYMAVIQAHNMYVRCDKQATSRIWPSCKHIICM